MRSCSRTFVPPAFFVVAAIAMGCLSTEEDISATAAPTTTGIPVGAPGAVGARVEPNVAVASPAEPRTNGIEEKIDPGPGHEPVIPPSPFGSPPDDNPPPATTKKKPKGTKI